MLEQSLRLTGDFESGLDQFETTVKESILVSGAAAMARVMYIEARLACPVSKKAHYFHGTHAVYGPFQPGNLRDSIYRVYAKDLSTETEKVYRITWNHHKAPYGFMVEYGTSKGAAHPFMRPAFDHVNDAIEQGQERMKARLSEGGHIPVAEFHE